MNLEELKKEWEGPNTHAHETMEFWVGCAAKGDNPAVCWQQCNRIANELMDRAYQAGQESVKANPLLVYEEGKGVVLNQDSFKAGLQRAIEQIREVFKEGTPERNIVEHALSKIEAEITKEGL